MADAVPDDVADTAQVVTSKTMKKLQNCCPGLRKRSQYFDQWLSSRWSLSQSVCLLTVFVLSCSGKFVLGEVVYTESINYFSYQVVTNAASLLSSLTVSFTIEGCHAYQKIFSGKALWRFTGVSFLFTCASALVALSRWAGTSNVQIVTVGYLYLPFSVIMSYYVFSRNYGKLEWLTLGMMTMAVLTFVMLREQYRDMEEGEGEGDGHPLDRLKKSFTPAGFSLLVCAVILSATGSIFAERIYKHKSRGLTWWQGRFYIMKVHIDVTALFLSLILWGISHVLIGREDAFSDWFAKWASTPEWFGSWTVWHGLMIMVDVIQGWSAGLITKEHSTSFKAIVQTLCYIFTMLVEDPVLGNRWGFQARELPSIMLAVILVLSAIVFQTGRHYVKVRERAACMEVQSSTGSDLSMPEAPQSSASELSLQEITEEPRQTGKPQIAVLLTSWKAACRKYFLIVLYILSDAIRNLTLAKALSSTSINPNSMTLVVYLTGVVIASGLTLYVEGCSGLKTAWNPWKILKCMPPGFLYALTSTLINMAFSQGMNAALALIIGKFYTPVAAIGAGWVLRKYYMWLEYVAIGILTLASMIFGYLQAFSPGSNPEWAQKTNSLRVAMLLVLGSSVAAAFNSLLTERILKGDEARYHVQKVRLDAACIISTMGLIPLIAVISSRAQDNPWALRPVDAACPQDSVCRQDNGCENPACDCVCASGIFAGWIPSAIGVIVLALTINTGYGWLVGKLVQAFSTVDRAIADAFSLLLVYFIGDPLLNATNLNNMCLNLVAFIVPLSCLFAIEGLGVGLAELKSLGQNIRLDQLELVLAEHAREDKSGFVGLTVKVARGHCRQVTLLHLHEIAAARLTELFGLNRAGTVYVSMKRFAGRLASLRRRKPKLMEEAASKEEPRCLIRAHSNKKRSKISCIIEAKDLVRFQLAVGNIMRQQMDPDVFHAGNLDRLLVDSSATGLELGRDWPGRAEDSGKVQGRTTKRKGGKAQSEGGVGIHPGLSV
ncbi:Srp14 [Symbiodinium microadriaticum]|nr:Srp14 [Symbiodinium microadriaticum]